MEYLARLEWYELKKVKKPRQLTQDEWLKYLRKLQTYEPRIDPEDPFSGLSDQEISNLLSKQLAEAQEHLDHLESLGVTGSAQTDSLGEIPESSAQRNLKENTDEQLLNQLGRFGFAFNELFRTSIDDTEITDIFWAVTSTT